jgi:hypothetical protein
LNFLLPVRVGVTKDVLLLTFCKPVLMGEVWLPDGAIWLPPVWNFFPFSDALATVLLLLSSCPPHANMPHHVVFVEPAKTQGRQGAGEQTVRSHIERHMGFQVCAICCGNTWTLETLCREAKILRVQLVCCVVLAQDAAGADECGRDKG